MSFEFFICEASNALFLCLENEAKEINKLRQALERKGARHMRERVTIPVSGGRGFRLAIPYLYSVLLVVFSF